MKDKVERSVELERFDPKILQAIQDDEIILLDFGSFLVNSLKMILPPLSMTVDVLLRSSPCFVRSTAVTGTFFKANIAWGANSRVRVMVSFQPKKPISCWRSGVRRRTLESKSY